MSGEPQDLPSALVRFVTLWLLVEAKRSARGQIEVSPRGLRRMGLNTLQAEYVLKAAARTSDQITAYAVAECPACGRGEVRSGAPCPGCFTETPAFDTDEDDDVGWRFVVRVPKPEHHAAHVHIDGLQDRLERLGVECRDELNALRDKLEEKADVP